MTTPHTQTSIVASSTVPSIAITRDFNATAAQLHQAHTDPTIYAAWIGPADISTEIVRWDARTGGSYAYRNVRIGAAGREEYSFHGSFHDVTPDRIVQTFAFDGMHTAVALETLTFEDLGGGRSRLHAISLAADFEGRDAMLASGMEKGIIEGYAKLEALFEAGGL